ncbi:type I methionyl aminopeptidase [Dactylosporangium sucinum]|uniref:Methionine aminopeptidase n=1 Tax=Dactylosporangium sucinum TaxID=1424081 RepID=A0A917UGE3_9ACTN|nr:type I methionyl aminopeptidase [Dactylosporangium sucinum]GGM85796.1 methionine aminopeptidase [Dactylosporangium sucinum]
MVVLKTAAELETMREAGRIVAQTLQAVSAAAQPGVTLLELDELARTMLAERGAKSSFLHYHPSFAPVPYPAVLCLSVNDAIVHGIPDRRRLEEGDLLSIDFGAHVDGYHGDAAVTVGIGAVDAAARRLSDTCAEALAAGIAAAMPDARIGDIGHAVQTVCRAAGYGMPTGYGGHGVGTAMHEDPHVPNEGRPGRGLSLRPGLVIAIEPMVIESGSDRHQLLRDGWTVSTVDGSRASHWEHTVAITDDGPVILTAP